MGKFLEYKKQILPATVFSILTAAAGAISSDARYFENVTVGAFLTTFIICFILYYIIISAIYAYADGVAGAAFDMSHRSMGTIWLACCTILIICWLPTIIRLMPGSVITDTVTGMLVALGESDNVDNPLYTTLLYNAVLLAGFNSHHFHIAVAIFCSIQALCFAGTISYCIAWHLKKSGVPVPVCVGAFVLFALLPVFPVYAFSMAKDSLFGLALLIYMQMIAEWVHDRVLFLRITPQSVIFMLVNLIMPGLRNGAWAIEFVVGIVIVITMVKWVHVKRAGTIPAICVLIAIISSQIISPLNVAIYQHPERASRAISVPIQQMAYIFNYEAKPEEILSDDEYAALEAVMRIDNFYYYDPLIVDQVKEGFATDPSDEEMDAFNAIYRKLLIKYPAAAIKSFVLGSSAYYIPWISTDVKDRLLLGYSQSLTNYFPDLAAGNDDSIVKVRAYDEALLRMPFVGLFVRIGIYAWMLFLALHYLVSRRKYDRIIVLLAPVLVMVACCFSPVNGYYRYAVPVILCTPIALMQMFSRGDEEKKE